MWCGVLGICASPALGWSAVAVTEFSAGTPIAATDVNANFSNINAALDGPLVRAGQAVGSFSSNENGVPIENAQLSITTSGGDVRVWFAPESGSNVPGQLTIEGPSDQSLQVSWLLERSGDGGATWERRGWLRVAGSNSQGTMWLAPSTIDFVDDPPAGEWDYRVLLDSDAATQLITVAGVRMFAREHAGPSGV